MSAWIMDFVHFEINLATCFFSLDETRLQRLSVGGRQSNVSVTNSTATKRTGVSSWKHLIEIHLNFTFEDEKKTLRGACYSLR